MRFEREIFKCIVLCVCAACAAHGSVDFGPGSTRVVAQLTGDYDLVNKKPTTSLTQSRFGIRGTDLGSSFGHNGKLYFLFGDTPDIPGQEYKDIDCLALGEANSPQQLKLTFLTAHGKLLPLRIPGISQETMEVPTCGISVNNAMYVVHTTQWYEQTGNMERSVLAKSCDDGRTWKYIYDLSVARDHNMASARFINASMSKVVAGSYEDKLPYASGDIILIWGSGTYRKSNPSLACIPADQIENKSALRYFCGLDANSRPLWNDSESKAADLFDHPKIGEFSVKWISQVKQWVMLYNVHKPSGICMRTAPEPWGPYSDYTLIVNRDFIRKQGWAAAYGPFIVEKFTNGNSENCDIYYTLSSWEPYATFLVCSKIKLN